MNFRRRQQLGWGLLAVAALAGGTWLLRLDPAVAFSSDVLDLMPADERAPELTLVRSLASEAEARTMFCELTTAPGVPAPAAAAQRFAAALGRLPAFAQVVALSDPAVRDALGGELFAHRFTLLFPLWLQERRAAYAAHGGPAAGFSPWLARDAVAALDRFLASPAAPAFAALIPADPLLLLPGAVARLQAGGLAGSPAAAATPPATLVWARLAASPLSEAGQAPAFAAIARATAEVQGEFPGLTVAYAGVNRIAAASRSRIAQEFGWLNGLSFAAVLAVAFTFIRQVHRGLHLVPVVLLAILGAVVCTTLAFDRVHLLVFVVGALLAGVAIDYGFYLFLQPPAYPTESYADKVRRLARPLLASCLTTVAGFALLLGSELPFIRQLGVYVGCGLICALGAAIGYFATVRVPFLAARRVPSGRDLPPGLRRGLHRGLVIAWLIALPGLARLQWRDDIRELEIPAPALQREFERLRGLFGDGGDRTVFLTYGTSLTAARDALEQFATWRRATTTGPDRATSLAAVLPTGAAYDEATRFGREHPEFSAQLRAALAAAGYATEEFDPFFAAMAGHLAATPATDFEAVLQSLPAKLPGPTGLLVHAGQPLSWFVTLAPGADLPAPPAATATVSAGQLQSLNRLFRRYRESALHLSLIGLGLVGAGVMLTYGWRDGARIFAIPAGACLGIFGVFGWLGLPLNLFHLLGAFLGVCLTHNYAIFSATSAYRQEPPPVSVRLSALTTAASFGVLACSGIPVVRALGTTVALLVIAALLVLELEHLSPLQAGASPSCRRVAGLAEAGPGSATPATSASGDNSERPPLQAAPARP